jgi:hypothetical protein
MPLGLDTLKRYLCNNNINIKGIIHIGSFDPKIKILYNSLNIHDNNIVWIQFEKNDTDQTNVFTTKIGENCVLTPLRCNLECCIDEPELIITEIDTMQSFKEFITKNHIDICEYNFWNFDYVGFNLKILKNAQDYLNCVDIIYTDINTDILSEQTSNKDMIDLLLKTHGLTSVEDIKEGKWQETQIYKTLYIRL